MNCEQYKYEQSTHYLKCRHQIGRNGFDYLMKCIVIGKTKSRKIKIIVFGNRYWKGYKHIKRIRYIINSYRLIKIKKDIVT